ncbi:hypothetical protein QBC44DRAFT_236984 [Cladorrhinum sp. PSN332]|nr:hypothetical protein QBC44DRAFT_236984 [Cladorrhinum sp. PSN332]
MSVSHPRGYNRPPSPTPRDLQDAAQPLLLRKQEAPELSSPPARKNIAASMTSFINRLRPSKRPEKGSTARLTTTNTNQPWENHQAREIRTASGSRPSPQRVNSISRHNPDAIPSSLWRTPISLPRRVRSTRERTAQETMSAAPQLIPRKKVPNPARGKNYGLRLRNDNQAPRLQMMGGGDGEPLLPRHPSQAVTLPSRHTRDVVAAKQELRRQRRTLKESGDFLGVTGINPYTGQMDVITPTTSSEEASPPYSIPTASHLATLAHTTIEAVDDYQNAQREAWLKHQHERAEGRKEGAKTILEQNGGNVKWQKKGSAWSSVATPKLSPIPQSQQSFSLHEMDSEDTVQRSPVNRSPNRSPFLGLPAAAMRMGHHRPAIETGGVPMPAIPGQQPGKSIPSSSKENGEPPLARSSSSRPRTIRFNLPPLITRRSGHCLQDISRYQDDQSELHRLVVPSPKGHRYRHSLPDIKGLQRINSGSVLRLDNLNPADQWASRLMQDLGCSETSHQSSSSSGPSIRTASSTAGEEGIRDQSVYTPIIITTGSECSQKYPLPMDGCGETTEDFEDTLPTPLSMSTPNTVFSPLTSSLSLPQTPSSIFSDLSASQSEMQLSVWPSIESRALETKIATSTREMVLPRTLCPREVRTPEPSSPKQEQDSVTTSPAASHEMAMMADVVEAKDTTGYSQHASTESLQSPQPAQWSMRKTMRQKADDNDQGEKENNGTAPTTAQSSPHMSKSTSHSHHREPPRLPPRVRPRKPSLDVDHAIARGAARAAFTHLVTATTQEPTMNLESPEVIPIKEPHGRRSLPRHHERRTVSAPVSDRESSRGAGPEERRDLASLMTMTLTGAGGGSRFGWNRNRAVLLLRNFLGTLCEWVRVVLVVLWILVSAYWDLVSPAFDGDSKLRNRLSGGDAKQGATWEDWGICVMALLFMFGVVAVGLWMVRGSVWVGWVVCKVVQGLWRVLGV